MSLHSPHLLRKIAHRASLAFVPQAKARVVQARIADYELLVLANEDVGRQIAYLGRYEAADSALLASLVRPDDICVDVGANVGYYTGLPSPYPYAWSLLVRAIPGAPVRLLHLLRSPQRPTWIVGWERPDRWQLDPHRAIARALQTHYRVVARVDGHPIYHRTSAPASAPRRRNAP